MLAEVEDYLYRLHRDATATRADQKGIPKGKLLISWSVQLLIPRYDEV